MLNVYWRHESCQTWCSATGQAAPNVVLCHRASSSKCSVRTEMSSSSGSRSSGGCSSSPTLLWEPEASQMFIYLFTTYSTTLSTVHIKYQWMTHWSLNELEKDMEFCGWHDSILLCTCQVTSSKCSQQTALDLYSNFFSFRPQNAGMQLTMCHRSFTAHHFCFATFMITLPGTVQCVTK